MHAANLSQTFAVQEPCMQLRLSLLALCMLALCMLAFCSELWIQLVCLQWCHCMLALRQWGNSEPVNPVGVATMMSLLALPTVNPVGVPTMTSLLALWTVNSVGIPTVESLLALCSEETVNPVGVCPQWPHWLALCSVSSWRARNDVKPMQTDTTFGSCQNWEYHRQLLVIVRDISSNYSLPECAPSCFTFSDYMLNALVDEVGQLDCLTYCSQLDRS